MGRFCCIDGLNLSSNVFFFPLQIPWKGEGGFGKIQVDAEAKIVSVINSINYVSGVSLLSGWRDQQLPSDIMKAVCEEDAMRPSSSFLVHKDEKNL